MAISTGSCAAAASMRVDVAAHVGRWPFRPFAPDTVAGLLRRMDATAVEQAVVANLHGLFYQNPQHANRELAEWVAAVPAAGERLVPFAVLNPTYPGWRDGLAECRRRWGFRGIRVYPQYHDYGLAAPELRELLALAEGEGLPVTFTLRMIDARGRSWLDSAVVEAETEQLRLEQVAAAIAPFPALRCLVLQAYPGALGAEALATLRRPGVFFDTTRATTCGVAGPNSYDLAAEQGRFGAGKFVFGSMSPFTDAWSPLLRLTAGTGSRAALAPDLAANALRLLGR
jgi:uncharacterized protein